MQSRTVSPTCDCPVVNISHFVSDLSWQTASQIMTKEIELLLLLQCYLRFKTHSLVSDSLSNPVTGILGTRLMIMMQQSIQLVLLEP